MLASSSPPLEKQSLTPLKESRASSRLLRSLPVEFGLEAATIVTSSSELEVVVADVDEEEADERDEGANRLDLFAWAWARAPE